MHFPSFILDSRPLFGLLLTVQACRHTPSEPLGVTKSKESPATDYNAGPLAGERPSTSASAMQNPEPAAANNRPSREDNMGRGFQGVMELGVNVKNRPPMSVSFMSLGNAARLRAEGAPRPFDVLFLDGDLVTLNHSQRSYSSQKLADLKSASSGDKVNVDRLDTRQSIEDVTCDDWKLTDGPLQIDACVAALSAEFDSDKLDAATGVHTPNWLRHLFADKYIPISAHVRDGSNQELYSIQLTKYAPGPVDASLLAVPTSYRQL